MSAITWVDGLVAFCLVIPGIRGWQSGLVAGLLRLAGVIVGMFLGWKLPGAHGLVQGWWPGMSPMALPWVAAMTGGVAGWIVGAIAAWIWRRSTRGQPIGWIDRTAGLALGVSKGALFVLVLLSCIELSLPGMRSQIRTSWVGRMALAPVIEGLSAWGTRHLRLEGRR